MSLCADSNVGGYAELVLCSAEQAPESYVLYMLMDRVQGAEGRMASVRMPRKRSAKRVAAAIRAPSQASAGVEVVDHMVDSDGRVHYRLQGIETSAPPSHPTTSHCL